MTGCPALVADGSAGIADALRAVDCLSVRATATGFSRLFGAEGALGVALTLILTLYVGLLAMNLLTGRSRLGLCTLTPRAFALGLALTFATSWVAYQSVVWNLAVGAPDQVASVVVGTHGSATAAFADRLDGLFGAVANAAENVQAAQGDKTLKAMGFTPADMLWLGALLLLLGTVGVLLVTRIALAALLAVGPLFVVLSLFRGTRGLFEGWLKGVALFAVTPLFAVLIGGGAVAVIGPVVVGLGDGEVNLKAAATVLVAALVYCALMAIALKVAVTLTAGWRLPGHREEGSAAPGGFVPAATPTVATAGMAPSAVGIAAAPANDRVRAIVASATAAPRSPDVAPGSPDAGSAGRVRALSAAVIVAPAAVPLLPGPDARVRGLGHQFRPATQSKEKLPC